MKGEYYRVEVTSTGGESLSTEMKDRSIFNQEHKDFKTLAEARKYVAETYCRIKGVKKSPMYRDVKGSSVRSGWVFSFWNADYSHAPIEKWWQEDWVEILRFTFEDVLITGKGRK